MEEDISNLDLGCWLRISGSYFVIVCPKWNFLHLLKVKLLSDLSVCTPQRLIVPGQKPHSCLLSF